MAIGFGFLLLHSLRPKMPQRMLAEAIWMGSGVGFFAVWSVSIRVGGTGFTYLRVAHPQILVTADLALLALLQAALVGCAARASSFLPTADRERAMPGAFARVAALFVPVLLLTALVVPSYLPSRISANEASATATLRTLNTAEVTYAATYHRGFSGDLMSLGAPGDGQQPSADAAGLVDPVLAGALNGTVRTFTKIGYAFLYSPGPANPSSVVTEYTISADPITRGSSGQRSFFTDNSGVVRANATGSASAKDDPI
jgi:branched-subunit amino acid transport protein